MGVRVLKSLLWRKIWDRFVFVRDFTLIQFAGFFPEFI